MPPEFYTSASSILLTDEVENKMYQDIRNKEKMLKNSYANAIERYENYF